MSSWDEVGERAWCRRYEPWDVTVGAVAGREGLLVVDTRASPAQAEELLADLRAVDRRPPAWVVNTHCHFDHTFGNARFRGAELWAHRSVPAALREGRHEAPDDAEYREAPVVEPSHLLSTAAAVDLGDRVVELHHLGRAHTDGDVVVWVPDAGVVFAGDLVEESGPPAYGPDSFPIDWPAALERLRSSFQGEDLRVVPGHGAVVARRFVERQGNEIVTLARVLAELWEEGVPAAEALEAGGGRWPWDPARLEHAVHRAYLQLDGRLSGDGGSGG